MNELQCMFIFRLLKYIGVWVNKYLAYVIVKMVHMDEYRKNKNDWNCDCCLLVPLQFETRKFQSPRVFLARSVQTNLSYENNCRKCTALI